MKEEKGEEEEREDAVGEGRRKGRIEEREGEVRKD